MSAKPKASPPAPGRSDTAAALIAAVPPPRSPQPSLLITKEHRRFNEFADTVRRNRYIGVCYGPPGIGKTISARAYAAADDWEDWYISRFIKDATLPASIPAARTAFWTPQVTVSPRELDRQVLAICQHVSWAIEDELHPDRDPLIFTDARGAGYTELLIVDEADRLKTTGLEQLRDLFDRHNIGLILIGMPGLEKRLARYPQLYSRIGFAHQYHPLSVDELTFVLTHHWQRLGLALAADDFTDAEAIAATARITGGNFRLIERLFGQVQRIMEINNLHTITAELIEAARETLVIGT